VVALAEDLYLLASDASSGRLLTDALHLDFGLGGAFLVDLAQRRRIALVDEHVTVVDDAPTGEPLLDSALAAIARTSRAHGPDHWLRHLGRGAHQAVQHRLIDIGVLRRDDDRILRVFPVHRTREADGRLHHELVAHLHDAVVLDRPPTPETAALAALALAVRLDRHLFPRADRRAVRQRMAEVAAECAEAAGVADAVARAVVALNTAMGAVPGSTTYL
jgi:hypothetical protein